MSTGNRPISASSPLGTEVSRRKLLRMGGLLAVGVAGLQPLLAACGSDSSTSPSPSPAATVAQPTVGVPTVGSAQGTSAATASAAAGPITVKAHELGDAMAAMAFDVDRLAVPSGKQTFNFSNTGKMQHELFVYPTQDLSKFMAVKRAGKDADEADFIKGIAAKAEDIDAGKSASVDATLAPGFYELACFKTGQNADGSSFVHLDKGQSVTIAVTGAGGPAASVLTPSSTISIDMSPGTGDLKDSWLFVPDHLMAKAGDVTFNINNKMDMAHDFTVYPLGDISAFVKDRLAGGENYDMIHGEVLAEDLAAGKSVSKTKKLTPGWWVAACFVVSRLPDGSPFLHRDMGQRFTFLVA